MKKASKVAQIANPGNYRSSHRYTGVTWYW